MGYRELVSDEVLALFEPYELIMGEKEKKDLPETVAVHPGVVLQKKYLEPLHLSETDLALHCGISTQRVKAIVRGQRGISAETAWIFAQAFGTTPHYWCSLQANYDLACCKPQKQIACLSDR